MNYVRKKAHKEWKTRAKCRLTGQWDRKDRDNKQQLGKKKKKNSSETNKQLSTNELYNLFWNGIRMITKTEEKNIIFL